MLKMPEIRAKLGDSAWKLLNSPNFEDFLIGLAITKARLNEKERGIICYEIWKSIGAPAKGSFWPRLPFVEHKKNVALRKYANSRVYRDYKEATEYSKEMSPK